MQNSSFFKKSFRVALYLSVNDNDDQASRERDYDPCEKETTKTSHHRLGRFRTFMNQKKKESFVAKSFRVALNPSATTTTTKLREKTTTTCVRRRKKVKPCVLLPAFYVFSAFSLSGYFSCRSLWSKVKTCRLYELFLNFLPTFFPFPKTFHSTVCKFDMPIE